jgi:hypothetical protein
LEYRFVIFDYRPPLNKYFHQVIQYRYRKDDVASEDSAALRV